MSPRRSGNSAARHGTYDEWATYLDLWSRGEPADASGLAPLHAEDFQGETWNRLTNRIRGAIGRRFDAWQAALFRLTDDAAESTDDADGSGYERALRQARDELRLIRALAGDERLPQDLREQLTTQLNANVRQVQQHLAARPTWNPPADCPSRRSTTREGS